jgi:murein DD-endopeptidase MepM/ murein hydrolase activator NlpD
MRPARLAAIASLLLIAAPPAAHGADGGAAPGGAAARPDRSGGAAGTPARRRHPARRRSTPPRVSALVAQPVAYGPDPALRVRLRLGGRGTRSMRLVLLSASRTTVGRLELGRVRTGRTVSVRWALHGLAEGAYRLEARGAGRTARRALAVRWSRFPVAGEHSFGGADARFGAPRRGHTHQGQDILAAAGTPVVAPRAATVLRRAYQKAGAGFYLVLHGDDGRDYVFMHLLSDSIVVEPGGRIATGQPIAAVGATGEATGPHLHFEIWVGGWAAPGGAPVDPLPELLAWDAWS